MRTPRTTDALLNAAEVRDLIDRAAAVLEDVSLGDLYDGDDLESDDANRRLSIGMEAYRFALRNAEALGDVRLLDAVLGALDINADLLWDSEGVLCEIVPEVLSSLLGKVRTPEPLVDELVKHARAEVRAAVAEGLRPRTRWARAHLEALAHDFWPSVRVPAQAALLGKRAVQGWWGRFERDPLEGLGPRQAKALAATLEALKPIFDSNDWALVEAIRNGALGQVLERLPLPLGAALAEKVARAGLTLYGKPVGLFSVALRGPDGAGFIDRWLADWKDSEEHSVPLGDELALELQALPAEVGEPLREHVLGGLAQRTAPLYAQAGFRKRAAQLLGRAWPVRRDPTPLLELILAEPEAEKEHSLALDLALAFRHAETLPDALLERTLEAQQAGWPGRWSAIRHQLEPRLEQVPTARLRPFAEKAVHHPDDRVASWALHQLLTRLHDPKRDGLRAKRVAEAWKEPRSRQLLIQHHPQLVLPLLRGDLREGRVTLAEAVVTLNTVGNFYGGVGRTPASHEADPRQAEQFHRQLRRDVRNLLGPSSRRGPPTAAEWSAFREVRARELETLFTTSDRLASQSVTIAPPGPEWDPEDRALFWRGIKLCWQTRNDQLCYALLTLMAQKPLREDMLILEKLHRIDAAGWGLGHNLRGEIRASLGLDLDEDDDEPDEPAVASPSAND